MHNSSSSISFRQVADIRSLLNRAEREKLNNAGTRIMYTRAYLNLPKAGFGLKKGPDVDILFLRTQQLPLWYINAIRDKIRPSL